MLEENRLQRRGKTEWTIGVLAYERLRLARQIDACTQRIAEIDREILVSEGALTENEKYRQDAATADAIMDAKIEAEETVDTVDGLPVIATTTLEKLSQAIADGEDLAGAPSAQSEEA